MINSTSTLNAARTHGLQGLRILVTAIDLEQSEHRGIAVYSKGVLKALREAGAEVWLLTQFDPSTVDVRASKLPSHTRQLIFSARVLESLNSGHLKDIGSQQQPSLIKRLPILKQALRVRNKIRHLINTAYPKRQFDERDLKELPIEQIFDNPYLQAERLSYLQNISGLICASDVFSHSFRLAQRREGHVLQLDLKGFDGLVTTCPLNIQAQNVRFVVQTIHDLIPLEYVQTSDHVVGFARRLRACGLAARLFISNSTRHKYETTILQSTQATNPISCVTVQSPSLEFPADACLWEATTAELSVYSETKQKLQTLKPCSFLLFNSSVEPRKNLLFMVKAFLESGVERQGIKLCVTGKLKTDAYSDEVKRLTKGHPDILLTGYIDEATKRHLYLNALAIVSPSLVEGFGIPVLDSACLGVPVIASLSESHREIQELDDFDQYVLLCSTLATSDWASAIRLVVGRMQRQRQETCEQAPAHLQSEHEKLWLDELRQQRIRRYERQLQRVNAEFQTSLCQLIHTQLPAAATAGGQRPIPRQAVAAASIKARI